MSSPIGREAALGIDQNSDIFEVKFSSFQYLPLSDLNAIPLTPILEILKLAPHSKKYRIRK